MVYVCCPLSLRGAGRVRFLHVPVLAQTLANKETPCYHIWLLQVAKKTYISPYNLTFVNL